jgi:UDP-N-acetylmuramyl pentapeptide phosphotransferase/UDP-N-acetylglucosamine-1-phosphate transferase
MESGSMRKKRDRELIELLNELRVVLPGVQVLFAFLLIAPFTARFEEEASTTAYMVALCATLVATMLLAPSAYHRLRWRQRDKERMLHTSNRLAIAGIGAIVVALTASMYLVTDVLLPTVAAFGITAATALMLLLGWFVLPLSTPYDRWDEVDDDADDPR